MLTEPTAEMIEALQAFANRNGRDWKEMLSVLWMNGRDYYEPEGTEIHSVRNELGPTWFFDECHIKPAKRARRA